MLGEKHRLVDDFPEFQDLVTELNVTNGAFASKNKLYNLLDQEIRTLELEGAPVGDAEMHRLKQERAVLKDALYRYLINAKKQVDDIEM